jgi:hypothetical protein
VDAPLILPGNHPRWLPVYVNQPFHKLPEINPWVILNAKNQKTQVTLCFLILFCLCFTLQRRTQGSGAIALLHVAGQHATQQSRWIGFTLAGYSGQLPAGDAWLWTSALAFQIYTAFLRNKYPHCDCSIICFSSDWLKSV